MSPLKFQSPLPAPRRADRTLLPALLALVLALLLVVQFLLPGEPLQLPAAPPGLGTMLDGVPAATVERTVKPQELLARPLFAPRMAMDQPGNTPVSPLGGATIAGSVTKGRRTVAVVRSSEGRITMVPVGGVVAGWRIVALAQTGARLRKAGETLDLPYGAQAVADEDSEEESDEDAEE